MNSIDRYAVIGCDIGHSRSPQIHAMFARATHQTLEYGLLDTPPASFHAVVRDFFAHGGRGLNVTVPHKQAALRLADSLTARAQRAEDALAEATLRGRRDALLALLAARGLVPYRHRRDAARRADRLGGAEPGQPVPGDHAVHGGHLLPAGG